MPRLEKDVLEWELAKYVETTVLRPTLVRNVLKISVYSVVHPIRRHATHANQKVVEAVLSDS